MKRSSRSGSGASVGACCVCRRDKGVVTLRRDLDCPCAWDVRRVQGEVGPRSPVDFQANAKSQIDFVVRRHDYDVGSTTGWHSHPGPVFITVTPGQLTYDEYDDRAASRTWCRQVRVRRQRARSHRAERVRAARAGCERDHRACRRRVPRRARRSRPLLRLLTGRRGRWTGSWRRLGLPVGLTALNDQPRIAAVPSWAGRSVGA